MRSKVQRRFNFTDRVRIPRHAISLDVLERQDGGASAKIAVELPEGSPHDRIEWLDADVVIEAWRMSTSSHARLTLGSVKELMAAVPSWQDVELPAFDGKDGITFRLKVISKSDRRLLAEADKITSGDEVPPGRSELIVVRPEDLGELTWCVDWSEEDGNGPVVLVNRSLVDNANYLTRDAALAGAIVPQVFREVLFRLCVRDDLQATEWAKRWLGHVDRFYNEPPPAGGIENLGEIDRWVREAASAFSAQNRFRSTTNEWLTTDAERAAP